MRAAARILGLVAVVFVSLMTLVASQAMPSGPIGVIVFAALGLTVLGYAIAWGKERVGGFMMIAGAIGLAALVVGQQDNGGDPLSAFVWAAPIGVAGYLFVRCSVSEKAEAD